MAAGGGARLQGELNLTMDGWGLKKYWQSRSCATCPPSRSSMTVRCLERRLACLLQAGPAAGSYSLAARCCYANGSWDSCQLTC